MLKNIFKPQNGRNYKNPIDNTFADFTEDEIKIIKEVSDFTMTSKERLVSLIRSVQYLEKNEIQGDFVECGVWKGGSIMAMIKVLQSLNSEQRNFWLFDTFKGMTEPKDIDLKFDNTKAKKLLDNDPSKKSNVWAVSSLDEVMSNISSLNYNPNKINFIEGSVENTLKEISIPKIALLRLDTDWYESTKIELEILFPKLIKGGVLIIDDYGHWKGCKRAVDEYFDTVNEPIFFSRIDYTGRVFVKYW